jgi:hypothetical protein
MVLDPYSLLFDPRSLPPDAITAYRQHRFRATFSVLLLILVHLLTLGAASPFLLARKYAFLPLVRADDFSTGKAVGFLFIPFFNLYWVFIVCRRLVDRLTLQVKIWGLPSAPSKALATVVAAIWCVAAIPYLGSLFWFANYVALWPIYLGQVQATCNRLALAATPPEAHPAMLQLERATRLRWLGWLLLWPSALLLVTVIEDVLTRRPAPSVDQLVRVIVFGLMAIGGVVLWYVGYRQAQAGEAVLLGWLPRVAAAYRRIDKNAALTVAWISIPIGLLMLLAGFGIYLSPTPDAPASAGILLMALAALVGVTGVYAIVRWLLARRDIQWLEASTANVQIGSPPIG